MSCQRESEGSSDGAGEGEAGERGACEECVGSVEGMRNLVSGVLSDMRLVEWGIHCKEEGYRNDGPRCTVCREIMEE